MRPKLVLRRLTRVAALMEGIVNHRDGGNQGIMVDHDAPALQYQKHDRQLNHCFAWLLAYLDRAERQRALLASIQPAVLERAAVNADFIRDTAKPAADFPAISQHAGPDAAALRDYAARLREVGE